MDRQIHNPRVYVDRIIDDSYHVVKQVYLGLDNINTVKDSLPTIETVAENLDEIQKVQDASDSLIVLNKKLDAVLEVQDHVDSIDSLVPHVKSIDTVASNIEHVQNAVVNAGKAEQYAGEALTSKIESENSADLAKLWAVGLVEIEPELYSSRKYALDANESNKSSQQILIENREIENYLKSNESVYYSIKENAEETKLVAGNINAVVNVATDLKGEDSTDISKDLGMIGNDDPSDVSVITGGNIKKVADDILSVRANADNMDIIRDVANSLNSLDEIRNAFTELANQASESAQQADSSANSAKETLTEVISEGSNQISLIKDQELLSKQAVISTGSDEISKVNTAGTEATNKALETISESGELVLNNISTAKTQSISAVKAQETSSISLVQKEGDAQKLKLDTQVLEATEQAEEATRQANIAKSYAEQSASGQLNADWNETSSSSKSYIKNKPDIYTKSETYSKSETNTNLSTGLAKKLDTSTYTTDKATFATKTAIADMLTKTEAQESYLSITGKAESAKTADSVEWSNVTGTEKVRTTDTLITWSDIGGSIDLGMIG